MTWLPWRRRRTAHLDLVRQIIRAFGMPKHVRSFQIEWHVNGALTVTVEHYPWKSGQPSPGACDRLGATVSKFHIVDATVDS